MSTLYIKFTPPSPVPTQYKIRYKKSTDISFTEVLELSTGLSPEEFSITGLTSGVTYDVEVQSYCGDSVFAAGNEVQSVADDCQLYVFHNSSATTHYDVEYVLCGSTNVIVESIAPLDNISRCCSNTTPPVTPDPLYITIVAGVPCTP